MHPSANFTVRFISRIWGLELMSASIVTKSQERHDVSWGLWTCHLPPLGIGEPYLSTSHLQRKAMMVYELLLFSVKRTRQLTRLLWSLVQLCFNFILVKIWKQCRNLWSPFRDANPRVTNARTGGCKTRDLAIVMEIVGGCSRNFDLDCWEREQGSRVADTSTVCLLHFILQGTLRRWTEWTNLHTYERERTVLLSATAAIDISTISSLNFHFERARRRYTRSCDTHVGWTMQLYKLKRGIQQFSYALNSSRVQQQVNSSSLYKELFDLAKGRIRLLYCTTIMKDFAWILFSRWWIDVNI